MTQKRQLVAILFADIENFTALVQHDEDAGKVLQNKFHKNLETLVRMHHGRVIYIKGDGACCIFRSAVDAVFAAIEVQQQMQSAPSVPLRIGIHLGDVIIEEKDIFGDGVNIASRVESFALPGSVLITENVFHEIRNHSNIKTIPLGKYAFKNSKEHIDIFAIANPGLVIPTNKKLSGKGNAVTIKNTWFIWTGAAVIAALFFLYFAFYRKPAGEISIAVIPFNNLSSYPDGEILSDGFTENILTSLSHISDFKIPSFTSTKQYKNKGLKSIKEMGRELNVAYILEGSVQRVGDKVRITAQLIYVKDDTHVWAKNYDEPFAEILAIQTKVSGEIASALRKKLSKKEKIQIEKKATVNAEAYQYYLKGRNYWNLRNPEKMDTALMYFTKAIELDPDYALAYSGIADVYTILGNNGFMPIDSVSSLANAAINKALELDSSSAEVKASYAIYLSSIEGNSTAALQQLENIILNNPNYASAFQWYAIELTTKGQFAKAKEMIEKAIVLDPLSKRIYITKAVIYFNARDINKAIDILKEAPNNFLQDSIYLNYLSRLYYIKKQPDSAVYYARLCGAKIMLAALKRDKNSINNLVKQNILHAITAEEIAGYYLIAAEKDSALVWLKKSVKDKEYGGIKFLAVSPFWDTLRNDPGFSLLLQNSGIH